MGKPRSFWFRAVACGLLLEGCGGSVATSGPGGAAGNPSIAVPDAGGASPGGAGPGGAGPGGAGPGPSCTGSLDSVSNALGLPCPNSACAATVLAAGCDMLPASLTTTSEGDCGALRVIELDLSPTRRKACYYSTEFLVGAAASDDGNVFCNGSASYISSGSIGADCRPSTLCDRANPAQHAAPVAPRACFDNFSQRCEPCCPAPKPDCTGKPDGYPGYLCVSQDNSYCSCSCQNASWACAC